MRSSSELLSCGRLGNSGFDVDELRRDTAVDRCDFDVEIPIADECAVLVLIEWTSQGIWNLVRAGKMKGENNPRNAKHSRDADHQFQD